MTRENCDREKSQNPRKESFHSTGRRISERTRKDEDRKPPNGLDNKKVVGDLMESCFCGGEGAGSRLEKTERMESLSLETSCEERLWFPFHLFPFHLFPTQSRPPVRIG